MDSLFFPNVRCDFNTSISRAWFILICVKEVAVRGWVILTTDKVGDIVCIRLVRIISNVPWSERSESLHHIHTYIHVRIQKVEFIYMLTHRLISNVHWWEVHRNMGQGCQGLRVLLCLCSSKMTLFSLYVCVHTGEGLLHIQVSLHCLLAHSCLQCWRDLVLGWSDVWQWYDQLDAHDTHLTKGE